jgi:hypothetical protein
LFVEEVVVAGGVVYTDDDSDDSDDDDDEVNGCLVYRVDGWMDAGVSDGSWFWVRETTMTTMMRKQTMTNNTSTYWYFHCPASRPSQRSQPAQPILN